MKHLLILLIVAGTAGAIFKIWSDHKKPLGNVNSKLVMQISSTAFANNGIIPEKYTCTGENVNPPLSFHGILADARSLALVMDDLSATNGIFTHWVVFNMSTTTTGISENSKPRGVEAKNSANLYKYIGPCPPSGEHRYVFRLYAIDKIHEEALITNKATLMAQIQGHILDSAELSGRVSKED